MKKTKHNKKLGNVVGGYKSQGYSVRADLTGHKMPSTISGKRPDFTAVKGRKKVIGEIETVKSMKTDAKQRQAFRRYAKKTGSKFRTIIVR